RWGIGALAYAFLVLLSPWAGYTDLKTTALLVTGLAIFIESSSMACDAVLQAHEKVQYQTIGQLLSAVVYFVLAIAALDAGYGLMGIIWSNVISRLVRLVVMVPLMLKSTGPWQKQETAAEDRPTVRDMAKMGFPLFLATVFGILFNKVDSVMLNTMLGDVVTGIYGLGHRALDIMIILPGLFGTAIFPALTRYGQQSNEDARRLGERGMRYMMIVIVPLTLFLMFVADPIINWFDSSDQFADSVIVLMIVIWGVPLQAASIIFSRLLITANQEKVFVRIGLGSMLANVSLNLFLIPRYSYFGASVATIISMTVSLLLHYHFTRRTELRVPVLRSLFGPTVTVAVAWLLTSTVVGLVMPEWNISWRYLPVHEGWAAFLVPCGAMLLVYILSLRIGRVIGADDLNLLKALRQSK
ncbi:MAG: O-antigen/teichoic acid export membrane protein, partial [Candidatus Krumholzibacteriia bacterium]